MSRPASKTWFVVLSFILGCVVIFAQTQPPQRSIQPGPDRTEPDINPGGLGGPLPAPG